jgi:alkylglycerol monooxygenase
MHLNILAFSVPLFVSIMLLEYYVAGKQQKKLYHFDEVIANLNVGIAERLCDLFTTGIFFYFFTWIYNHFRMFDIVENWVSYILLFLFTDFIWYWYHRLGHEVNILWSTHVVHHQSEDFNYTVSVRITVFQAVFRCLFWSFLPLIGFHPATISIMLLLHGAYPFFTHTQVIGKLGWLEYLLVTPSHHRVHHSSNPEYMDKNYGDILIVWDKLFGTFAPEINEPRYGLNKPLKSHSFLWQHFHFILEIAVALKRAKGGWREYLRILLGKPDNIDPRIRLYLEKKLLHNNNSAPMSATLYKYIKGQTLATLSILFFTLLLAHYINGVHIAILSIFILVSVINTGAMLEQKKWIFELDFARLGLLGLFLYSYFPFSWMAIFNLSLLIITVLRYKTLSQHYYNYFFS